MRTDRPVVLGAGVAGLSMAWELARAGTAPLLVSGARRRTSEAAAGMLAPGAELALSPSLGRLAVEALRHYPAFLAELAEHTDIDPGYRDSRILRLAYSDADAELLREGVGAYEAAGFPSRWLDARGCAAEVPGIGGHGLRGGLLSYDEAQVLPAGLLAALADAVQARGGDFLQGEVTGLGGRQGEVLVSMADGEVIEAARVVVALGSWTARLAGFERVVRPVKGQVLVFIGMPGPRVILYHGHSYIVTKSDGSVVVGGTVEPDAGFADGPDDAAQALRELLPRLWPALRDAPSETRAGLRPAAPDEIPVVGPVPGIPGAYLFTGHYRNGFLLAPFTARLAAEELLGGAPSALLQPCRPSRL